MNSIFIQKNTYDLCFGDTMWIYQNLHMDASVLARELLKLRFDDVTQFKTDADLAQACLQISQGAEYEFERVPQDHRRWQSLVGATGEPPEATLLSFRTLWRGFTDKQLAHETECVLDDKTKLKTALSAAIKKNDDLLQSARKNHRAEAVRRYRDNAKELGGISGEIDSAFTHQRDMAFGKLLHMTRMRRRGGLGVGLDLDPDDYTWFSARIRWHDPENIEFPLRFLTFAPVPLYRRLRTAWRSGAKRNDLLRGLIEYVSDDSFYIMIEAHRLDLQHLGFPDRSVAFAELKPAFGAKCYLATTLLAVTQTEGLIWDLADHMNSKGVLIYQRQTGASGTYNLYPWDETEGKYKNTAPGGTPKAQMSEHVKSARELLKETRLKSIIAPEIYGYLVDEFYDDRNLIAHGAIQGRDLEADAAGALLCLRALLYDMREYLVRGRKRGTSS